VHPADAAALGLGEVQLQERAEVRKARGEPGRLAVVLTDRAALVGHLLEGDDLQAVDGRVGDAHVHDLRVAAHADQGYRRTRDGPFG
jgi:hypothetical protein